MADRYDVGLNMPDHGTDAARRRNELLKLNKMNGHDVRANTLWMAQQTVRESIQDAQRPPRFFMSTGSPRSLDAVRRDATRTDANALEARNSVSPPASPTAPSREATPRYRAGRVNTDYGDVDVQIDNGTRKKTPYNTAEDRPYGQTERIGNSSVTMGMLENKFYTNPKHENFATKAFDESGENGIAQMALDQFFQDQGITTSTDGGGWRASISEYQQLSGVKVTGTMDQQTQDRITASLDETKRLKEQLAR